MGTTAKKARQENIANKKPKEKSLDQGFRYSSTGLDLKHNNFNKKWLKHMLFIPLLTSAIRQIINNDKLVVTKKKS
jgi:hypothetical protein